MGGAGGHAPLTPLPEPVGADAQERGQRPLGQPARLLETREPLGEVRWEDALEGPVALPLRSHGAYRLLSWRRRASATPGKRASRPPSTRREKRTASSRAKPPSTLPRRQPITHHHFRIVGRCTPAITSVGCIELPQIHLPYCIHNEPGQVTLPQPIPHGRRHQVALVSLTAQKVISHSIVPASCFYQLTASPTPRKEGLWDTLDDS